MPRVASNERRAPSPVIDRPVSGIDKNARKIVRPTTVELVTRAMRQMILSGSLAPGEVLRQEALAEELGVSRVPIREAITRLRSEGLLEVVPHKGAYVRDLSIEEVRETFEIRLKLEPWIFAEAIARIDDHEIGKAEQLVVEMDRSSDDEWGRLGWRFHETLYRPAQREITLEMLRVLNDRSDRYFRYQVAKLPIRKQAYDEHMQLVNACRKRDVKAGARLLQEHLEQASKQIVAIVESLIR